jgi:hypothetical protein
VYADERIAQWLETHVYHPRSDAHGKALCEYFLDDLVYSSELLRQAAANGQIVYQTNYEVRHGSELQWNVDLVLGPPSTTQLLSIPTSAGMMEADPAEILLAGDAKSVMTEHGKARRNRQRDLNSFASIMKHCYPNCIVGGIVVVNIASRFRSPLRPEITQHRNIVRLVEETVQLFREIPRTAQQGDAGIEAIGVIVVEHTNIHGDRTRLITNPPAPQSGDPVHYQTFLRLMKEALESRLRVRE